MLRVVLDPDGVTPRIDFLGKLPGRGAYICPTMACIKRAVEKGGFRRAFKCQVTTTSEQVMQEAWQASRRQLRSLVSLAGRAGRLSVGTSRVEQALHKHEGHLLLMAQDASAGVRRKYAQWATRVGFGVVELLSKEELGAATGQDETALVVLNDPGFAAKIAAEARRSSALIPMDDAGEQT